MFRPVERFSVRLDIKELGDTAPPAPSRLATPVLLLVAALAGGAIGGILPLVQNTGGSPVLTAAGEPAHHTASIAPAAGPR
jgi:hypothetical protein